jgi:hypothetical protein
MLDDVDTLIPHVVRALAENGSHDCVLRKLGIWSTGEDIILGPRYACLSSQRRIVGHYINHCPAHRVDRTSRTNMLAKDGGHLRVQYAHYYGRASP